MKSGLLLFLSLLTSQLHGQDDALRLRQFNLGKGGLAIEGYDPVSYFSSSGPVEGKKEFSVNFHAVVYRFATRENLEKFKKDPSMYEPAYGGWCAYAMGKTGEKVEVDPETYKIIGGHLFLFYNAFFNNTLPKWNADEKHLHENADRNWAEFYPVKSVAP
ncbi:MAG TPA: YHS domain-containing (seleno)protein [Bacteroidia bacterium]|nr:YHS domain-containing (seleno)protein [Bacteroidia bacterium]